MISENFKVVQVANALDLHVGTHPQCKSVNMSGYHKATFIVHMGTLAVADISVAPYGGAASGTATAVIPFKYTKGSAAGTAATSDVLAAWTDATALVALATAGNASDNYMFVFEVDAAAMGDYKYLTLQFDDTVAAGSTGLVSASCILEARYTKNRSASAIA